MSTTPLSSSHLFQIGGLAVPDLPNTINFGRYSFEEVAKRIDLLEAQDREWEKCRVLSESQGYLGFLNLVTGSSARSARRVLGEFTDDSDFRRSISDRLSALDRIQSPGDLRFHAISLYAITRLIRPKLVVETGVAHGKSSAFILLALRHNGWGELYSYDIPPSGDLADGSCTSLSDRETGWLVPDYLRDLWHFSQTDSVPGLIDFVQRLRQGRHVDMFVHDSLHTYDHVNKELEIIDPALSPNAVVACDNIDMEGGKAWSDWLKCRGILGWAYRDFGAARLEPRAGV